MSRQTKIERKFGRFAIPNLTWYLVGGQGIALILSLAMPDLIGAIQLLPAAVSAGQWWRVASFIFTPPFGNPIFAIFTLYFLYFMGSALESHWGTFRYNVYVLIGFLLTIGAAFLFPMHVASNTYITASIFLAFGYLFPDYEILLFFVLPVRVKWLAAVAWLYYGFCLVTGDWPARTLILAALTNFFLFFGRDIFFHVRYGYRRMQKKSTDAAIRIKPIHVCTVCGVTDKSDRNMDFRYCTRCEPPLAYCMNHLRDHEHRRTDEA